ncbi:type IV pilin protein [Rubrivivax gelatinosus]|uniref:Fimbrial protein, type IV pilin, putative PilE n=1 Tax=Rubrivivax gelatinosus (strain NBRC 100245 / IL144) TaxID=983917 RepID=I0HW48_RUBGI|nr:type IV pilin protein [Rubrivivax gelatinosus]BAL97235.1 fimbrial protein, type IV pilin, putative PilE [Rubrivivax gelatinosus IL144]
MSIRCRRCSAGGPAQGFTLIELAIVVVVLGVLAAVALPSFMDSIRKGRRSDAYAAVAAVQQAQERWRSNHAQYTTSLTDLGLSSSSSSGHYTIEIGSSGAAGDTLSSAYVVTARGNRGSSQASDSQCRNMSMRLRGGNLEYAGCGSCGDFSYAVTNACWPK